MNLDLCCKILVTCYPGSRPRPCRQVRRPGQKTEMAGKTIDASVYLTVDFIANRNDFNPRNEALPSRWMSTVPDQCKQYEGSYNIRRPMRPVAPQKKGPPANRDITDPEVQLIDAEGNHLGPTPTQKAMEMAEEAGLDLVAISPNARPPVCKILDLGKYKYQAQKKAADARKRQKVIAVKEIKLRPNIDTHDYLVKTRNIQKFIDRGDKVKVTIRFRGREMAHMGLGRDLLTRVKEDFEETTKVEFEPKTEGRLMTMVIAPK